MNKKYIVNEIKKDMKVCIDALEAENLYESRNRWEKYFELLELLYEIDESFAPSPWETEEPRKEESEEGDSYQGSVHLRLGGGVVGERKVFIPEKILRLQNIGEGDEVRATVARKLFSNGRTKTIYNYELVRKFDGDADTERRVIRYAQVQYDYGYPGLYILGEGEDGEMRIDLEHDLLGNLNVSEGDIVDYAYWKKDPLNGKVIWKHNLDSDNVLTEFDNNEPLDQEDAGFIRNAQITVFGGGEEISRHVKAMLDAGGDVIHVEDLTQPRSVERNMDGADLVLVYLDAVRPSDVARIRDGVKKRDLEVLFVKDKDLGSIFSAIRDKLENGSYYYR